MFFDKNFPPIDMDDFNKQLKYSNLKYEFVKLIDNEIIFLQEQIKDVAARISMLKTKKEDILNRF